MLFIFLHEAKSALKKWYLTMPFSIFLTAMSKVKSKRVIVKKEEKNKDKEKEVLSVHFSS
jgi:hypothetical protein